MTPLGRYVVETIVTLLAVLGLAIVVLYATRRFGGARQSGPISLVGRLVLDARRTVYLVKVGETLYLLGSSEAGLTKLGELESKALGDFPLLGEVEKPRSFKELLDRFQTKPLGADSTRPESRDAG